MCPSCLRLAAHALIGGREPAPLANVLDLEG